MNRTRWTPLVLLLLFGTAHATPPDGGSTSASVEAVEGLLQVERTMLDEDLKRYDGLKIRRVAAMSRLVQLYRALDATFDESEEVGPPSGDLDLLLSQLSDAEGERATAFGDERVILEAVRDRMRRVALLEEQRGVLLGRAPKAPEGTLSGTWDLVMMPIEQRGSWSLEQSGAVINGTYELDGGWSGSLQGTLVDRKVFLIRIDSKLGKVMEYEGFLSADKTTIRGSWLNYELAGSEGSTGHWTSVRRSSDR